MSTLIVTNVKNTSSATNNIVTNTDGSATIGGASLLLSTAVASTSGTSIDFTSIPSYVKRITVMFQNISLSGSDQLLIQLGDSEGVETTGYNSSTDYLLGNISSGHDGSTAGFILFVGTNTNRISGTVVLNNISGNFWIATGIYNFSNYLGVIGWTAGEKELSSTLTSIRITGSAAGAFDSGSVNIMYE